MSTPGEAEPIAVVSSAYELIADGGVDRLMARFEDLFTKDFAWRPALAGTVEGRTYQGREGFDEYWRDFTDAFEDLEFEATSFELVGPDRVLVLTTVHAFSAGARVPIERRLAHLWEIRDCRIGAGYTFLSEHEAREHLADA